MRKIQPKSPLGSTVTVKMHHTWACTCTNGNLQKWKATDMFVSPQTKGECKREFPVFNTRGRKRARMWCSQESDSAAQNTWNTKKSSTLQSRMLICYNNRKELKIVILCKCWNKPLNWEWNMNEQFNKAGLYKLNCFHKLQLSTANKIKSIMHFNVITWTAAAKLNWRSVSDDSTVSLHFWSSPTLTFSVSSVIL